MVMVQQAVNHYIQAANGLDLCTQEHRGATAVPIGTKSAVKLCLAVQVYYTVDSIGEGGGKAWKGGVGYVTREMATEHIPPPSDDNLVLVCGPPPMYKALSGEKKSPKDQGDWVQLQYCASGSLYWLGKFVSCSCYPNCCLKMCRGAIRTAENIGLHRAASLQVLNVNS